MSDLKQQVNFGFRRAQATLDIIIGITILAVTLAAAMAAVFSSQSLTVDTEESLKAVSLARQNLERAVALGKEKFSSLSSSSSTEGEFLKEIIVELVDPDTKKVRSVVSWQTDPQRRQKVELVTFVTNWQVVISGGGGAGTSGDWTNPRTLGSVDLGPGNEGTDLQVRNKIVYMTARASALSKPDFFIIDATDGQNPVVKGSINTGPGLSAVALSNTRYAYVANEDANAQLQIIDISSSTNPILVKSFKLPGTSGKGISIFVRGNLAYVGVQKDDNSNEFHIVDVSDAANPVYLGKLEVGKNVNMIGVGRIVTSTYAFIAKPDNAEFWSIDVSSSTNPVKVGEFDPSFSATTTGQSVYLIPGGVTLYGGQRSNNGDELYVIDVAKPDFPTLLGSKEIGSDINDLYIRDNLAFLATSDSNNEFQVWNISDPTNIVFWSSFNFSQVATGIDYEDNLVYVSVRSNDALRIITSSP